MISKRKAIMAAAIAAALVAGGATWSIFNRIQRPPEPVEVNWDQYIARSRYHAFQKLTETLRQGTTLPDCVAAFEHLIQEPDRLERIRTWTGKLAGPDRPKALRVLYAELMLADSDPDILYDCANADIQKVFRHAADDPLNYGQFFSWGLSRPVMACLIAYQATGQARFLELVAGAFERTLPFRDTELGRVDEVRGRAMHNWGTNQYSGDGRYSAEITTAGRVTYPIALLIQIVRRDPALHDQFAQRAERYLEIIRRTMDEYESEYRTIPGTDQGYFLHVPRQLAEPLNHMAWAANGLHVLGQLTGEKKYLDMAQSLARYFKASMWTDEYGCLVWQYAPQPGDKLTIYPEWVWKSRTTIDLPMYFAQQEIVFSTDDLRQLCKTFLTNIYRGDDQGPGRWNATIYHPFDDYENHNKGGGLLCVTNYIRLGEHEPRIRQVLEEMVATRPRAGGWLHRTHGIIAYAYRLCDPGFNARRAAESLHFPGLSLTEPTN